MSELENGRLVRLMSKLGFVNERPEYVPPIAAFVLLIFTPCFSSFNHELRWSETGDRYIVSLFRDYVFHQVDEGGNPVVNLTHVITCLNKVRFDLSLKMDSFIERRYRDSTASWTRGRTSGLC